MTVLPCVCAGVLATRYTKKLTGLPRTVALYSDGAGTKLLTSWLLSCVICHSICDCSRTTLLTRPLVYCCSAVGSHTTHVTGLKSTYKSTSQLQQSPGKRGHSSPFYSRTASRCQHCCSANQEQAKHIAFQDHVYQYE